MSTRPLTASRRLVEKLKPEICCSESRATCRDDDFCSSDPGRWPVVSAADDNIRLTYPADKNKPSIPGVPEFCDAYIRWHTKYGCGFLAKEITGNLSGPGKSVLVESLKKRCAVLFDDALSGKVFNEDRAEDLSNISSFCQHVDSVERHRGHWGTFFKGGGAAGGLAVAGLFIWKVIKTIKKISSGVYKVGSGISKFAEGVELASRGIKRLVTTSIPNFARTMKYVFTFGWLKGRKPPEIKPPEEDKPVVTTKAPSAPPEVLPVPKSMRPHIDVVRTQLSLLTESGHHATEGKNFAGLDYMTRTYISHLAIKMWGEEPNDKKEFYIQEDRLLTEGKLPVGFIMKFAVTLLSERNIPLLCASAKVWAAKEANPLREMEAGAEWQSRQVLLIALTPEIELVRAQLITDARYARSASAYQNYLARKAIFKWNTLPDSIKMGFVRDSKIPADGELPVSFVRAFRKREFLRQGEMERHAFVFEQVAAKLMAFDPKMFSVVDARAAALLRAWKGLPHDIQREFVLLDRISGAIANNMYLPASFVEFMHPLLSIGTISREISSPSSAPWIYGDSTSTDEIYHGFSSGDVMRHIVTLNRDIAYYPAMLRQRAKIIIDLWLALNHRIRSRFAFLDRIVHEQPGETQLVIPFSFISFAYSSIGGFSIASREAMSMMNLTFLSGEPDDDKPKKPGGGHGGAGLGSLPSTPPVSAAGAPVGASAVTASMTRGRPITREIVLTPEFYALIGRGEHDMAANAGAIHAAGAGSIASGSQFVGMGMMQMGIGIALPMISAALPLMR